MIEYLIKLGEQVYRFGARIKIEKLLPRFASNESVKKEIIRVRNSRAKMLKGLRKNRYTKPEDYIMNRESVAAPEIKSYPGWEKKKITNKVSLLPKKTRDDWATDQAIKSLYRKRKDIVFPKVKKIKSGEDFIQSIIDYKWKNPRIRKG